MKAKQGKLGSYLIGDPIYNFRKSKKDVIRQEREVCPQCKICYRSSRTGKIVLGGDCECRWCLTK